MSPHNHDPTPAHGDISEDEIDFTTIEEDLKQFQQDEVVSEALSKGVDLRQYSRQIDADLLSLEIGSIPSYIAQAPRIAQLHQQIDECDQVLASMETMLHGFQTDLGGISDEIKHLQDESLAMNIKLKNRKTAEKLLHKYLKHLIVPDQLIVGICTGPVNDEYLQHLRQLDDKLAFVTDQHPVPNDHDVNLLPPCDSAATQDVEPQLERLRLKAVAKVRTFLLEQVDQLKKPKTNVQIMQENVLLKFAPAFRFLCAHAPAVAEEVRATYVESMSRIISTLFKSYQTGLASLQLPGPARDEVVAIDANKLRAIASRPKGSNTDSLTLAEREALLSEPDAAPIIMHVAQSQSKRFPFDALFRSVQKHLMDSATSEYLFTMDFFGNKHRDTFNQIFVKTLSSCLEFLENHLHGCSDTVSLLLMIRTTLSHRLIMERRRIPCLDGYLDRVNLTLWPCFKQVLNHNLASLQRPNLRAMGTVDLGVHYVSKRYALYVSKVYALSTSLSTSDEGIPNSIAMFRAAYENVIQQLAATHQTKKMKTVYLVNNYDAVLSTFSEVSHASCPDDTKRFEDLLRQETANFVEEELGECYKSMIQFVKMRNDDDDDDEDDASKVDVQVVNKLIRDFTTTWRNGLELINSQVVSYFASPDYGRLVLKKTVTQLLLYYTRFQEVVKTEYPSVGGELMPYQEICDEIKQCVRQF